MAMVLFFFCLGWFWLPGAAIVLGFIGTYVDDTKGMAITGIILGFLGLFIFPNLFLYLTLALWD